MAVARRVATPPAPPQAGGSVNFGDDSFYTGSMALPEGNYALTFHTQMYQATKADGTPSRLPPSLATMVTAYPIDPSSGALIGEPSEHPFTWGSDAHESFAPSADGKGIDAVPNGRKAGVWKLSNWGILLDSIKQAGLPPGLLTNDFGVLDGIWVHTRNIPEPEEKTAAAKKARAKTGAAAMMGGQEEDRGPRTVTIVQEILENGKPWDGTGGIPADEAAPAPAPARAAARPAARPAAAPRAAAPAARPAARATAPAPAATELSDEDVQGATVDGVSKVLAANPNLTKLSLKNKAFEQITADYGDEVAQAAMTGYLQSDEMLSAVLGELGYAIVGLSVKKQ